METKEIVFIDKNEIKNLKFGTQEVLENEFEITERWRDLNYSMILGNIHKVPVRIIFRDENNEEYKTETTIWSVTEKNVILKNNTLIPISSILKCN